MTSDSAAQAESGFKRRWAHIVPIVFILYTIAYLDRVNVGMALPSMSKDLALTPTQAGFVGGIFFWGYVVSFLSAGWLANRFGAKRVILTALFFWGVFAMGSGLAQTYHQLLAMRVLLGLSEGPIWSSVAALLTQWFLKDERARAFGCWNLSIPAGALLSGPISGLVLSYTNWHVMFVLEGLPAWIGAVIWWWMIPSKPASAAWLPASERAHLLSSLTREDERFRALGSTDWHGMFRRPALYFLLGANCFNNLVQYGFALWLPTAIKDASAFKIGSVGVLSAIPYIAAGIGIVAATLSSDRMRERRLHAAVPLISAGVLLYLASHAVSMGIAITMVLFTLSGFFLFMTLPLLNVIMTDVLPRAQAVAAISFTGGISNLFGGTVGPTLVGWLKAQTGDFSLAFSVLGGLGVLGGLLVLAVRVPRGAPLGSEAGAAVGRLKLLAERGGIDE